ncbi:MAG: hypothetical protein ABI340_09920 [Nitrososphaera sp.]|jgi:hypothetical protein
MVLDNEIKDAVEKNMELMLNQTKAYLPFIRVAFPSAKDLPELCFNLMVGNALSTFITQFSFRMKSPNENDFAAFGTIVESYRKKVKALF